MAHPGEKTAIKAKKIGGSFLMRHKYTNKIDINTDRPNCDFTKPMAIMNATYPRHEYYSP